MYTSRPLKCCVAGCEDLYSKRHRFPIHNLNIFKIWVRNINHPRFKELTTEQIYKAYVICHKHFSDECKVKGTKRGLIYDAVPTLFIPDFQETTDKSSSNTTSANKSDNATLNNNNNKENDHAALLKILEENVPDTAVEESVVKTTENVHAELLKILEENVPDTAVEESAVKSTEKDVTSTKYQVQSITDQSVTKDHRKIQEEVVHSELPTVITEKEVPNIPVAKSSVKSTERHVTSINRVQNITDQSVRENHSKTQEKKIAGENASQTYKILFNKLTEKKSQLKKYDIATLESPEIIDLCDDDTDQESQSININEKKDSSRKAVQGFTPMRNDVVFLTPKNISTICRICLKEKDLVHLFEKKYEERPLGEILETCTPIKIKDDTLSQYICQHCSDELLQAYNFRRKCVKSEQTLLIFKARLAKSKKKKENEHERQKKLTLRFHDYENVLNEEEVNNITHKSNDGNSDDANSDDQKQMLKKRFYLLKPKLSGKPGITGIKVTEIDKNNAKSLISDNHQTTMSLKVGNAICHVKTAIAPSRRNGNSDIKGVNTPGQSYNPTLIKNLKRRKMMLYSQFIRPALCSIMDTMIPNINSYILKRKTPKRKRKLKQDKIPKPKDKKVVIPGVCEVCKEPYNTMEEYKQHSKLTKHYLNPYACKSCGKIFPNKHRLKEHWNINHDSKKLHMCEKCGKCYKLRSYLLKHLTTHGQKKFVCRVCGSTYLTLRKVLRHKKTNHPSLEKKHCCELCGKIFAKLGTLRHHRNCVHLQIKRHFCDICGKGFQYNSNLKKHMVSHSTALFACKLCNKSFKVKDRYLQHIKTQHPGADENTKEEDEIQVIQCNHCDRLYRNKQLHSVHLKEDHEANICIYCDTFFYTEEELEKHRKLRHTDISDFSCRYCGRCFPESVLLFYHLYMHRTRCYQCHICHKKFMSSERLKLHNITHTQEKLYKCRYCDKAFVYSYSRIIHERVHSGDRPYICDICGRRCICSSSYKRHRRTHIIPSYTSEAKTEFSENKV